MRLDEREWISGEVQAAAESLVGRCRWCARIATARHYNKPHSQPMNMRFTFSLVLINSLGEFIERTQILLVALIIVQVLLVPRREMRSFDWCTVMPSSFITQMLLPDDCNCSALLFSTGANVSWPNQSDARGAFLDERARE